MGEDVFVSYSREDETDAVLPICKQLRDRGLTYWLDKEKITCGSVIRDEINLGLSRCRCCLVILSQNSLKSPFCKEELNGILSSRKAVILVRHGVSVEDIGATNALLSSRLSYDLKNELTLILDEVTKLAGASAEHVAADIVFDFSHNQHKWSHLENSDQLQARGIATIKDTGSMISKWDLISASRVLVVPPPLWSRFSEEEIKKVEDWVRSGGGLFLMGHYDEPHHGSNFSALARRFDFDFRKDLLLPDSIKHETELEGAARGQVKSVDKRFAVLAQVDAQTQTTHPIVNGIKEIALVSPCSIQSMSNDNLELQLRCPASTWIMNPIGQFEPDGSRPAIDHWELEKKGAAVVLAARRCGKGRIVVCGTWKLWTVECSDNRLILDRIISWLGNS